MRARIASLGLSALFFAACGSNTIDTTPICSPACGSGETCEEGICKPHGDAGPADSGVASENDAGSEDAGAPDAGCTANSQCPSSLPICDSNRDCTAPATTAPATLAYAAVLITNAAYQTEFEPIALMHTVTGVPTRVMTVEDICAIEPGGCSTTDACHDAPKAIKDYLVGQYAAGLQQVVLGGDASIVPSRLTEAKYSNPVYPPAFDETFYSDDYYGDMTEWDSNGDCIYGDADNDTPGYIPQLGVTRISVSSAQEVEDYFAKEQAYLTSYDTTRLNKALFLSNVATELTIPGINVTVPIDSALYFETPGRTLSYVPNSFDITKLYSSLSDWPGASALTVPAETAAFEAGYNIVVHSGHGDEVDVTVEQDGSNEFSGQMAYDLTNTQFPIMISCACDAATFADGDTCAGQNFITSPMGGGIGYLGNAATGLGIAGGMQLLDQFLKYTFSQTNPLVGDAVRAAHVNMPESDGLTIPDVPVVGSVFVPVVDATSWRWTQKAATYLGDGLLPIYTDLTLTRAPSIQVRRVKVGDFSQLVFTPAGGAVGVLTVANDNNVYEIALDGSGTVQTVTVAGYDALIAYGFTSATTLVGYQQRQLP